MKQLIMLMLDLSKKNSKWYIGLLFCSLQTLIVNVILSLSIKMAISPNYNVSAMIIVLVSAAIYLILVIPFVGYLMSIAASEMKYKLTHRIFKSAILKISIHSAQDLQCLQSDVANVSLMFGWRSAVLMQALSSGIFAFILVSLYAWPLAIITMISGPMLVLMFKKINSGIDQFVKLSRRYWQQTTQVTLDVIDHLKIIKLFHVEATYQKNFNNAYEGYRSNEEKMIQYYSRNEVLEGITNYIIFYTGFFVIGSVLVYYQKLSLDNLLVIVEMSTGISFFFSCIGGYLLNSKISLVALEHLLPYLEQPNTSQVHELKYVDGTIEFINVSLSFNDHKLFENMNLTLLNTAIIKLTGKNGAGKSTLFKLINNQISTQSGCVMIDGQDVRYINNQSLRCQIGYVSQHPSFMQASVYHNIVCDFNVEDQDILDALELVELEATWRSIDHMKDCYLEQGHNELSTGQLQRLSLVRALVLKPKCLLIDELDANIEEAMYKRIIKKIGAKGIRIIVIEHHHYLNDEKEIRIGE